MKAAITVKLNKGFLVFPYSGPISLTDIENAEVVSVESYSYADKVGRATCTILEDKEEKTDE